MAWRDVRAALIAVALVPHLVWALPIQPALTEEKLQTPLRQRELAEWSATLGRLGVDLPPDELGDTMITLTGRAAGVHRTLKAPFRPLQRLFGLNQSWPLFGAATTHPTRLTVEVVRGGRAQVWFRRLDDEHRWLHQRFRYRRLRGIYDLPPAGRTTAAYRQFADGVAGWAFEADPEATEVRVYLEETPLTYPWEPPEPPGPVRHRHVVQRPR
jgi:hypothetical protein